MKSTAGGIAAEPPRLEKTAYYGPVTAALRRRTLMLYLLACICGMLPALLGWSPGLQAAGLNLLIPGAGFVAAGGWWTLLFPVFLLVFLAAMGLWLFTGNLAVLPLVLVITMALSYVVAGDAVSPLALVAAPAMAAAMLLHRAARNAGIRRAARQRRDARNVALPEAWADLAGAVIDAPAAPELSAEELATTRRILDLAMQPAGQFDGFTRKDSFQTAALRYQLNHIQYALAVQQRHYTPNFHGYLNRAQRYTIDSLQSPDVCGYWRYENAWGNFSFNADPVATRDNIMLTGWSGLCLGLYAANTGDLRYGEKGCLEFRPFPRNPDRVYAHDHHDCIDSLTWNWKRGAYTLFPCEPRFTYSQCNLIALAAAMTYDRVYGTDHTARVRESFLARFHGEFEMLDGEIQPILSDLTGLSFLFKPSLVNSVANVHYLNTLDPALGRRVYALVRHEEVRYDPGGSLRLNFTPQDSVDPGNYAKGRGFTLIWLAIAAREMGDEQTADAALQYLDATHARLGQEGVYGYEGLSASTSANYVLARLMRKNYWRDMIHTGPGLAAFNGPLLEGADYPDVLVARAVSDGADLDLVLYNGGAPGARSIRIERLKPSARYRVSTLGDAPVESDADGSLTLQVPLDGRTPVRVVPAD